MTIFERFKNVKAFAFDVDGVLTNGEVLVTEDGDQLRTFHVKDGYAIQSAIKRGYPVLVITGGKSQGVKRRLQALGVEDVFLDEADKDMVLKEWIKEKAIDLAEVLFMGDDYPDLAVLQSVGFATCPNDAIEDIKNECQYISPFEGGKGAVRDVIEKVMRLQNTWEKTPKIKSI